MDKNGIPVIEKPHGDYEIHRQPKKGMGAVHRNYGLWILHVGTNYAPVNGFHKCSERYFEYYAVSHLFQGQGRAWIHPDYEAPMDQGQCVIVAPHVLNRYGGSNGREYHEDTVNFTGPVADMLLKAGVLKPGVFNLGSARVLLPIIQMARDPGRDAQINANIALQRLLVDIYNENKRKGAKGHTVPEAIERLIKTLKDQADRWWTVEEMAEFCGLSKDQFRRVFKKHTGILPKLYLDKLKMQKAADLLMSTDLSVADIAEELSYRDCYHFSRRFKEVIGFSPRRYRQEFRA